MAVSIGKIVGVVWRLCKRDESGQTVFVGDMNANVKDIKDVASFFTESSGCAFRIGKTSADHIFERAVQYECVHRPPTHAKQRDALVKVGQMYKKHADKDSFLICTHTGSGIEGDKFFDKIKGERTKILDSSKHVYMIGKRRLTFGCKARIIFRKAFAGGVVVQVEWAHNHDLKAFASTRRRDPATFVKEWFSTQYTKGVPAMKALRSYVDHLFLNSGLKDCIVGQLLADR